MVRSLFLVFSIIFVLFSCAPSKNETYQVKEDSSIKVYEVEGIGEEYFSARKDAIKNGIIRGIIDIIGKSKYDANYDIISKKILEDRQIVADVSEFTSSQILDRDDKKVVRGIVKVNLKRLKDIIDKLSLGDSYSSVSTKEVVSQKTGNGIDKLSISSESSESIVISRDSPLFGVSFLVFIPDDKVSLLESQEEYKMLVEAINSKLSDLGLDYIDFNRIRDLSKKFSLIYEEKSGQSMSIAQMMAQDVKANVYIEADIDIKYDFVSGNNVSIVAVGTLKAYDSSTGRGLGIITFTRPKKTSRGMFVAKTEVISEIVSIDLLKLLKNVEDYYSKGVKIDISIIGFRNLSEEKEFSTILDSLPGLGAKKRKSISGNIAEYEIVYKGGVSAFVDDLVDTLSNDPKYSKVSIDQGANRVVIKIR